ncbi:hypothetical protein TWF694_011326 [Orbilia ellipsospora]|uniref:Acid protease n=1 Tax=Orbilia ellipsospora TaxID=2528407 RepID=A0AAV9X7U5_9PEZI
MKLENIVRCIGLLGWMVIPSSAIPRPVQSSTQTANSLAGCTESVTIEWASPDDVWSTTPSLNIIVDGVNRVAGIDTGSTGALMDVSYLPAFNTSTTPQGHVFYSSSKVLAEGYWVPNVQIEFIGLNGKRMVSKTPILGVEKSVLCPQFNATVDGNRCPNTTATVVKRAGVVPYFGIGFGRDTDQLSQSTAEKNPMINIISVNNVTVNATKYHQGYVITNTGITVGLTSNTTQGFAMMDLLEGPNWAKDHRGWAGPEAAVALNDGAYAQGLQGSLLVDTGVPQMYLKAGSQFKLNDSITIAIPNATKPVVTYTITDGGAKNVMSPSSVLNSTSLTPFINTGRSFLKEFDVAYNPIEGQFGVRFKGTGSESFVKFSGP